MFHICYSIGNVQVDLRRYLKDARSIPVAGESSGQAKIGAQSQFTIADGLLYFSDPENGTASTPLGTHIQYLVNEPPQNN